MNDIAFGLIGFARGAFTMRAGDRREKGPTLAAIADSDAGRRAEAAAAYPQAAVFADYRELLTRARHRGRECRPALRICTTPRAEQRWNRANISSWRSP